MTEKIYFEAKVKKSQTPIEKVIKDLGINYPNESLGFLHAIYAKADGKTPNLNRVILAKSVKEDVPQLRFTQVNMNHKRAGFVMGTILDSWINPKTDEIEIVFSFFKSLYPEHWEVVEEAINDGNLNVSFELTVEKKNIVVMANGVKKVKRCNFDGVGLLFPGVSPAYPNAKVLLSANEIVSKIFDNNKTLICASVKEAVDKIEKSLEKIIKEKNVMNIEIREALLAKFKEEVTKELGEEAVKDWSDEKWEEELAKRANTEEEQTEQETTEASENEAEESEDKEEGSEAEENKETKSEIAEDKEENAEESENKEEKAEDSENKEDASESEQVDEENAEKRTTKTTENRVYEVVEDSETGTMEVVETIIIQVERDGKVVEENKVVRNTVYTQATVDAMKADYESKLTEKDGIISSKDREIEILKDNAKKVIEIRAELGDMVSELSDEDLLNDEKINEIKLQKANQDKIEKAKEELKDNEFAKDFTDEDYLSSDKVENAKLKKEVEDLKSNKEVVVDGKKEKEELIAKEENDDESSSNARKEVMKKKTRQI